MGSPLRILILEASIDNAESMSMLFTLWGHEARWASEGSTALDIYRDWQPDVFFVHHRIRGMSSLDLLRLLHASDVPRKPLLIAMTGWGNTCYEPQPINEGFDHQFTTPIDPSFLRDFLEEYRRDLQTPSEREPWGDCRRADVFS